MMKTIEARVIHLRVGDTEEMEDDEHVVSAVFETPHIWLVVVKERPGSVESQPNQ